MQAPADIKYAGVVVAQAAQISEHAGAGWFLSVKDPLPVGTTIEIVQDGGAVLARVEGVVEATEGSGMRVQLLGDVKNAAVSAKAATNGASPAPAPVAAMAPSGVVAEPISALAAQSPVDGSVGRSVGDELSEGIVTVTSSSGESAAVDATGGDGKGRKRAGRRKR